MPKKRKSLREFCSRQAVADFWVQYDYTKRQNRIKSELLDKADAEIQELKRQLVISEGIIKCLVK